MLSSETRAAGFAALSVIAALGVFGAVETTVGFPGEWVALVSFLLVAVLGYAVPQLYLAKTDTSVSPSLRLRTIPLVFLVFGPGIATGGTPAERAAISALVVGSLLLLAVYEFRSGYLSSSEATGTPEKL
jgi:hypothetical protein